MRFVHVFASALATAVLVAAAAPAAHAVCVPRPETPRIPVSRTFVGGATWTFEVARRQCEGLVIHNAVYTPAGTTTPRTVLTQANIAELHVPYLANTSRFLDVTDAVNGLGNIDPFDEGANATSMVWPLKDAECAPADRHDDGRICVRHRDHGYRWKFGSSFRKAEQMQVFMVSQVGGYTYINRWEFHDDGSIKVRLGLTGDLEQIRTEPEWAPLWGQLLSALGMPIEVGMAHMHNVYYRLDFDVGGAANDLVSRRAFTTSTSASPDGSCTTAGQCGKITTTAITSEAKQTWSPTAQNTWIITDKVIQHSEGRSIGYELLPRLTGLWRGMHVGADSLEPWAGHEVWVTRHKACEQFAALNESPYVPNTCLPGPNDPPLPGTVDAMVNGESVDGQNVVVWYANRLLHYPRDEDQKPMPVEWTGFDLIPRNIHITNPSAAPTP